MKLFITFTIFLLCRGLLFSQAQYTFMYEKGWSAHSGAENLTAANYLYGTFDKNVIPVKIFGEKKNAGKVGNVLYRFAKTILVDVQLNVWAFIVQHEYFGHTVRAKQVGFYNAYPQIGFPYSYNKPVTNLNTPNFPYSKIDIKLIYAGGNEANIMLANTILTKVLLDKKILNQQSILFFHNNAYQSLGIIFMRDISDIVDIREYNYRIHYRKNEGKVNSQFKTFAWIDFLADPMNFIALYSVLNNYIYKGNHNTKIPMIKLINGIYYLPAYRFNLAPYSPESVYENYFRIEKKLLKISFRHSVLTRDFSFGFSFKFFNYKIAKNIVFDTEFDVWRQEIIPFYTSKNDEIIFLNPEYTGFALINTVYYKIFKKYKFSIMAEFGYKSGGYLEGEMLNKGLILRGGLSFNLN